MITRHWRRRHNLYKLVGSRCRSCGRVFYPYSQRCIYCGSREVEQARLEGDARLVSYSIVYSVSDEAKYEAPVILGMVDIGGVKVIAELTDVSPGEVEAGMSLEPVLRRVTVNGESGLIYYAVKFRPRLGGSGSGGD
ncbi:MAG: Zn-ribbon domain-containing OB-fold protein [Desulfurococcales archaeon]|nr:Zn-ribbon domain-containing OB-fold protein [Desulfurococcales archaeon]